MHDLGVYYARGEGAMLDDATAFRWFRLAAEFGVADSQYNLGLLYQQGRGVAQDAKEALFWFLSAAAQGDDAAIAKVATVEAQLTPLEVEQARARARAFHARPGNALANGEFPARAEQDFQGAFEAPEAAPAQSSAPIDG
jgi:localization factor PodJL